MKEIIEKLTKENKTISFMESCTGGFLANSITNLPGASEVLKGSLVTYSNEFKIKFGVKEETIEKYSVYSLEVAKEMSYNIAKLANANYGVGVTGKLNGPDKENKVGEDDVVFLSIFDKDNNIYYDKKIQVEKESRIQNKEEILEILINLLKEIL